MCEPEVSLSSDFISGFCGETEDDHQQTLSLIREVGYNVGFLFAYSMRKVSRVTCVNVSQPKKNLRCYFIFNIFSLNARKHTPSIG